MPCDIVTREKVDEIPLRVAAERGFAEMGVFGEEVFRPGIEIGEVAAPTAGNADLFTRRLGMIQHENARPGMGGAHHAGGAGAKDQRVDLHRIALGASGVRGQRVSVGAGGA